MELTLRPTFQDVSAGGVELRVQTTEIVVDWCGAEHTDALALTGPRRIQREASLVLSPPPSITTKSISPLSSKRKGVSNLK